MKTVELLESDSEVRNYYQNKFRYVLVDEYQDTNYAQFVLTKLLSDKYRNIMVVGDDDQSIYRFRGATVENILNFDKTYPDATVVKLEQNYRSTKNILEAANSVISKNTDRHSKKLWCDKGDGERITVHQADDQNEEGRYIIRSINSEMRTGGRRYSDFAVLYRVNALGRALQTAFVKSGVPYKVVGDLGFYERKEVKDMIAYLTVLCSPANNLRLKRIINEPKRKIGTATVEAIEQIAEAQGASMFDIMKRAEEYTALKKNSEKLSAFTSLVESVKARCSLPSEMINALFEETGYKDMLRSEGFEGEGKIQNVEEFISAAVEYEKQAQSRGETPEVYGFLEEVALITDVDKYDENADAVILMTVHAAKGLEFPVVFIAGMEDGIFPSSQNIGEPSEMSEERRLCYVAITRAKEKLFITHAKERMMYGRTSYSPLSVFVKDEIPEQLLYKESPRPVPPRYPSASIAKEKPRYYSEAFAEFNRKPEISSMPKRKAGAAEYGIDRLSQGTRVSHGMFGEGTVVSARDMGGDVLYEVDFDTVGKKKLMATFAKLKKI
jgi:DNA helicase-2/ATP-dependent DNA helicase PcrA